MKTIWKYHIINTDTQTLNMPTGAKPMAARVSDNGGYLWVAIPNTDAKAIPYTIVMFGTGQPIEIDTDHLSYLDTIYLMGGNLVLHIYWMRGEA